MSLALARRAASGDMSCEVSNWIKTAFEKYLAGDDLERSFGLDRASKLRTRNKALLEAAEILDTGGLRPWEIAGRLASAIQRFETRVYPRFRREACLTPSPLNEAIWRAFESGSRMVRTQHKLWVLLR